MHFAIGILIAAASLVYWLGMASKGAREISSTASGLANLPRRRRFQKKASQSALELIEDPVEAATIAMIAVARSDGNKQVSDTEAEVIKHLLSTHMDLRLGQAEDLLIQSEAMTQQIALQDTLMMAMIDVLRGAINTDEAASLADMLNEVALADGPMSVDQKEMIRRFKERLGVEY